ncbi:aminoglycoside phosphotransferase family protein [Streptomyces sp. NBC_01077]|uniref:phosphotransferase n=1 Tax=Streptomyces sp. NBC_01077 TaxID=2903746 RepID=UPI00386914B7|nr:aminoglycoside phosphotransferase family protein [Streptomyces sp. NBC_01077]
MIDTPAGKRLTRVLSALGMPPDVEAVPLESYSNDAWRIGDRIVRVCWRGDIGRLRREAAVVPLLPPEIPCPEILAAGDDGELAWTVTRRMPGQGLHAVWPTLDDGERRKATAQLADVLRALHTWQPPEPVRNLLVGHLHSRPTGPEALVGADLCPLPVERAQALAAHASPTPGLGLVAARLAELAGLDPYLEEPQGVVHGDLHFANLLWDKGRITAVLDFEWVRLGPPDLDLLSLLRSVDWAGSGDAELLSPQEMTRLLGRLAADYPELFAHTDLAHRLWLYQLAYTVRELYTWPPAMPDETAPDHPVNSLPRFGQGPDHLHGLLTPPHGDRRPG